MHNVMDLPSTMKWSLSLFEGVSPSAGGVGSLRVKTSAGLLRFFSGVDLFSFFFIETPGKCEVAVAQ